MEHQENLSWEAPAHEHTERSNDWYWALGVLAVAGAVISLLLGNPLFSVIIALAALSLGMLAARGPRSYQIELDPRGITVDDSLYLFRSLESFWIDTETRDTPHLILTSRAVLVPQLVLPLAGVDPHDVRDILIRYIEEKEQYESPFTRVAELFGF
jgi:hypothetical protein